MKKNLLCITPDLSRSGAPIALYSLIRILKQKSDYDINVLTYGSGDLLGSYEQLIGIKNIEIIEGLDPSVRFKKHLQNDYDVILLNTVAVYAFSFFFQNTEIPVYWWIHEAPELIEFSVPEFPNPHLLSTNFQLLASSAGAAKTFHEHYAYDISSLPVPVYKPKEANQKLPFVLPEGKVLFVIPSAYTYIKGQDILLSAIQSLPIEFKEKSYFIFCGYSLEKQAEYKHNVLNMASGLDNVLMLENLPQNTVYSLINKCHCVIAPSRIDTIPLTIVEGLMYHKLALVSDNTGISYYIRDCVNGFVFSNPDELFKRLLLIISDHSSLSNISESGYLIYNNNFSPEAVASICEGIGL